MKVSHEWRDSLYGRNIARLTYHDGEIYVETEGNHDGTVVCTSVRISRPAFVSGLKQIGGIL
jgi:hypothetical protein